MENSFNLKIVFPIVIVLLSTLSCDQPRDKKATTEPVPLDTLRLALDWSPNILHAGIFLAEARSAFEAEGLYLDWFTPEIDDYQKKPILRLLDKEVDLAIGPSEHLFYYALDSHNVHPRAEAIATLLSKHQSAFAVKAQSAIYSPSDWGNKNYIGYDTPLEEAILKTMIRTSGSEQMPAIVKPGRLQVWDVFKDQPDAIAWIFTHWEGQLIEDSLRYFYPHEWGVPYGYSSVVMAGTDRTEEEDRRLQLFLKVVREHYLQLAAATKEKRKALVQELISFIEHPNFSETELIEKAYLDIQPAFAMPSADQWGQMKAERWQNYLQWIQKNQLLENDIDPKKPEKWFTNSLLRRPE